MSTCEWEGMFIMLSLANLWTSHPVIRDKDHSMYGSSDVPFPFSLGLMAHVHLHFDLVPFPTFTRLRSMRVKGGTRLCLCLSSCSGEVLPVRSMTGRVDEVVAFDDVADLDFIGLDDEAGFNKAEGFNNQTELLCTANTARSWSVILVCTQLG